MKQLFLVLLISIAFVSNAQETFDEFFEKGYEANRSGNYEEVVKYMSKCALKNNSNVHVYFLRSLAYHHMKMLPEALKDINRAIMLESNGDDFFLSKLISFRATIYAETYNYKEAIAEYSKAISYDPEPRNLYLDRARCYSSVKDYNKALKDYLFLEEKTNKENVNELAQLYFLIADTYVEIGNLDNALIYYNKSLDVMPNNIALVFRGCLYFDKGNYNQAISDLTDALPIFKTNISEKIRILVQRSKCYLEIGQYEKAISDLNFCIQEDPDWYNYSLRGYARRLSGRYEEAISDYSKSIELKPKNARTYSERGWAKAFNNDLNGALLDYNKAIELYPEYAYAYLRRGVLIKKLFGKEKAKIDFEKVIEIENKTSSNDDTRYYALFYLDKHDEAIDGMMKFTENNPTNGNYYDMACLYSLMNNKRDALKYLDISFENGYIDYIHMANDDDLNNIKFTDEFQNLLNKYNISVEIPIPISDIDIYIPETNLNNKYRFALIIGNEDYSSFQTDLEKEVNVNFARNDAMAFKEYSTKVLGIPDKNITFLTNATTAQIMQGVKKLSKLASVTQGEGELFFYYAGHGISNPETKESFLVPVDVNSNNLEYAVKLQDVYNKLTEYSSKRTIVFLDACFSGGARNKALVEMRGVKVKPKQNILKGNILVFASSSGTESSQSFAQKKHGLFTYYFLKILQETQGDLTYEELFEYIKKNVSLESILSNNKSQTPILIISPDIEKTWNNWKLN